GAPLVTDAWEGLDQFFTPGREIIVAHDCSDVTRALDADDAELARIAAAARERVLAEHTAQHRAVELEQLLEQALHARHATPATAAI
ncbi:MAG TPA: glycosyltransferase, partial [Acidobacteriota bacterium]|nr:glycosyltransferase [Acidobacteriota bacterium]